MKVYGEGDAARLPLPDEAHPRWRGFGAEASRHPPMRGWLAVPLVGSDGKTLGILQLSDKYRGEFSADDEQVAMQFAQMAVIAIERARLAVLAISDPEATRRTLALARTLAPRAVGLSVG